MDGSSYGANMACGNNIQNVKGCEAITKTYLVW